MGTDFKVAQRSAQRPAQGPQPRRFVRSSWGNHVSFPFHNQYRVSNCRRSAWRSTAQASSIKTRTTPRADSRTAPQGADIPRGRSAIPRALGAARCAEHAALVCEGTRQAPQAGAIRAAGGRNCAKLASRAGSHCRTQSEIARTEAERAAVRLPGERISQAYEPWR